MENTVQPQNIVEKENARRKFLSIGFLAILMFLIVVGVLGFVFKDKILMIIPFKKDAPPILTQNLQTEDESAFSGLVGENTEVETGKLEEAMKHAFTFSSVNRASNPDDRPVLGKNEIAIEVIGNGDLKTYKFLKSNDPNYKFQIGDQVEFEPINIRPDKIIVKQGNTYYYMNEIPSYTIPESLVLGDKVIFLCKESGCENMELSWAFVFKEY